MHICLSVIRIFALKTILCIFIDGLMLLMPWLHKILTTILLFVFGLCLSDVDHLIFVCTFPFQSVEH